MLGHMGWNLPVSFLFIYVYLFILLQSHYLCRFHWAICNAKWLIVVSLLVEKGKADLLTFKNTTDICHW